MTKKDKTIEAVSILHRRYIKDDAERGASIQEERVHAEVARLVYDMRKYAGLTQKELAEILDTTQSVISRLEDADYDGHSLSMLHRVAEALKQKLTVTMTAKDPDVASSRRAFVVFVRMLRRRHGLTIDQLADRAGIDREEVVAMEWNNGYRPTPLTLHKLGEFFSIPQRRLAALAGAVHDDAVNEHASRFAAQSESFAKLTREERRVVDEFAKFLKAES